MPELPEVETIKRGLAPHILGQTVTQVIIRQPQLRWEIPVSLSTQLPGQVISNLTRRGKYLLIQTTHGTLLVHFGMSGSFKIQQSHSLPAKHDHVDLLFDNDLCLRFHDPRRFGCILWTQNPPEQHKLIKNLGPEPLSTAFTSEYIYNQSRHRKIAVKPFIMNSSIVTGVGNIYATEALFLAGIAPHRPCNRISKDRYALLCDAIKQILKQAIRAGGTTLKDFMTTDGKPGYFKQQLLVYSRAGEPCSHCKTLLHNKPIGQRQTTYCPSCQK